MNARLLVRRTAAPAVIALAAGLSLSGCGEVGRGDEAVRVNDTVIPSSAVQTATREITAEPKLNKVTTYQVAALLAYGVLAEPIAQRYGKGISDSMVRQQYPQFKSASQPTLDVLRTDMVLSTNLQGDQKFAKDFQDSLDKAKLEINPRYGVVDRSDPQQLPIRQALLPWIKHSSLADKDAVGQG